MLFILGAFLAGGAVGFAAERAVSKPAIPAYDAQQELARELALNDAVRDSARVLMMNSFDSTQTAAFRRLIERNQRYADSVARARGGKR